VILFLDTSSLVKLYVEETHSAAVREWVVEAEVVAACRVAYPEAVSALGRRMRAGDLSKSGYGVASRALRRDWERLAVVDFREIEAGRLASKYGLRGFDAIHLSSAMTIATAPTGPDLLFFSFDTALNRAAAGERLQVLAPAEVSKAK
jgi:predicted nucleic acid-binding protein